VRYGAYEPPSFRYSETGREHLVDFLVKEYLACAIALGEPYLSLWPEFDTVAEREGDIGFLSQQSWTDQENVFVRSGPVPERLAQQSPGYDDLGNPNRSPVYPSEWPLRREEDDVTTRSGEPT
jgi:hypothetical protein